MRDLSCAIWYRLGEAEDTHGLSCGRQGAFVGPIPLLKRVRDGAGRESWQIRSIPELNLALSAGYGLPVDFVGKLGGIVMIVKALNEGNIALAQIATVQLRLPDLPRLTKGDALGGMETVTLASLLSQSGVLEIANQNELADGVAKRDVSNEPRIPRGQPGAGQWTGGGATVDRSGLAIPAQELIIEPIVRPTPIIRPAPLPRPAPGAPTADNPPIGLPTTVPREVMPTNPYPDRPECEEEWQKARKFCTEMMIAGKLGKRSGLVTIRMLV
jgi:hypothetical protein